MLYRRYLPEDFNALYAIEEACFQQPFRFGRRYMRQLVEIPNAATWIAELDGRMVGFAIVDWTGESEMVAAYIQTIEVTPSGRGRGVAGNLLARIEGSAQAARARVIWLHVDAGNVGAIRLYEASGYLRGGREENYYPRGRPALVYYKSLESMPAV